MMLKIHYYILKYIKMQKDECNKLKIEILTTNLNGIVQTYHELQSEAWFIL